MKTTLLWRGDDDDDLSIPFTSADDEGEILDPDPTQDPTGGYGDN